MGLVQSLFVSLVRFVLEVVAVALRPSAFHVVQARGLSEAGARGSSPSAA